MSRASACPLKARRLSAHLAHETVKRFSPPVLEADSELKVSRDAEPLRPLDLVGGYRLHCLVFFAFPGHAAARESQFWGWA
jgi:hypothetical protein